MDVDGFGQASKNSDQKARDDEPKNGDKMEHCAVCYTVFISNTHALKFPFQDKYMTLYTHITHHPPT